MNILICGATGFLGRNLTDFLRANAFSIFEYQDLFSSTEIHMRYEPTQVMQGKLETFLIQNSPISVINAAWVTRTNDYRNSELNRYFYDFSRYLYEICLKVGVSHFVGIGSSAEYGPNPGFCHELTTPILAYDEYSYYKIATLEYLKSRSENTRMIVSWIRLFQPYGKSQTKSKFIQYINEALSNNQSLDIQSANTTLDWIHVKDVANAINFILENRLRGIFNVGTGVGTSSLELVELFRKYIYPDSLSTEFINGGEPHCVIASENSALNLVGWHPRYTLLNGVREVFAR